MPATIKGTAGLVFGLASETGGIIQSMEITDQIETAEAKNHEGEVVGVGLFNRKQDVSFEFIYTGAGSGLGAIDPAETITLANYTPAAGLVICTEIATKLTNNEFRSATGKAVIYPLVTS